MIKRAGGALLLSIEIDRSAPGTVSHQLYSAMRDIIHAGGMHIGERLPASRTLARELRISRTTVINVFEILTSEGLIESRTGAGTFVSKVWMATRPPETEVVEPLDAEQPIQKPHFKEKIWLPIVRGIFFTIKGPIIPNLLQHFECSYIVFEDLWSISSF